MAGVYTRNKRHLPVAFKACPKCGGTGQIPCNGKEYYQAQSHAWAKALHGKIVTIPWLKSRTEWTRVPGVAVYRGNRPGGYGGIKVYLSVDVSPNWGGWGAEYGTDEFDEIDGHRFYFIEKGQTPEVEEIQCWPENVTVPFAANDILQLTSSLGMGDY